MEIKYLGPQSFLIKGKKMSLLTAPLEKGQVAADIVLFGGSQTQDFSFSSHPSAFGGGAEGAFLVPGPGEYEVKGVKIKGVASGEASLYLLEMEKIFVGFLGQLSEEPSGDLLGVFEAADILIVPVEGGGSFGPKEAAAVTARLEPRVVIPEAEGDASLESFCRELGKEPKVGKTFKIGKDGLPEELEVIALERP